MLNIVLFGPPGCGKGTQAELLVKKYGIQHISTGDAIRQEIKAGSELGKKVTSFIEKGHLCPDELVIDIIADYINNNKDVDGNIFDGFPRTTAQAEEFDKMLASEGLGIDLMVSLDVPDEELIQRIIKRAEVSGRADDSDVNVIKNRIDVYKAQTAVVADYYSKQGKYFPINGIGTIEEVFGRICECIDKISEKK
ncbi:MAG: adenylate kinase [Rikenellaceae bacterium]|nr:adenylate kinase [Rikenellaceae bacterium]